jgi:hypothetical protein
MAFKLSPGTTFRSLLPHLRTHRQHDRSTGPLYASPRDVRNLSECVFYHDMDIPGYGSIAGAWDLRGRESEYLGGVDFRGKRVLEIGTANGALGFWIERQGAELVCYDLSPADDWDIVPYAGIDDELRNTVAERKDHIGQLNNGWWLAHRAYQSKARLVHGDVYHIPGQIGPVDVVTFGAILLHLRDPFLALQNGLRLARETAVVVDMVLPGSNLDLPTLYFVPDGERTQPRESWWLLTPALVVRMLGVLGFGETQVSFHTKKHHGNETALFTVVGRRTRGSVQLEPVGR